MRRLQKAGLFSYLPSPKTPKKTKKPAATAQTIAKLCFEHGELNVSEVKRQKKLAAYGNAEPVPVDGQTLPSSSEGWQEERTTNPELYCAAVRVIRLTDGSSVKLFKVLIRPDVLAQKRKAAKKLLKRVKRENRQAADVAAKRKVRALLFALGKV
jgi:hypothetical protein